MDTNVLSAIGGIGEGINRGVQTAGAISGLLQAKQKAEREEALAPYQQEYMASHTKYYQSEAEKNRIAAEQAKREAELVPVDEKLAQMGFRFPEERQHFKQKALGYIENIGGVDYLQRGTAQKIWEKYASDPASNLELGMLRTSGLNKQIEELQGKIGNPEALGKLKPEAQQQLQAQHDALVGERTRVANNMVMENRKLRAANKEAFKTFYNQETNTWQERNTITGETIDLGKSVPESVMLADIKERGEKDAKFREFETVNPQWKGKKGIPEYGKAFTSYENQKLANKVNLQVNVKQAAQDKEGFKTWTPEAKQQEFMLHAITGRPPVNAAGLGGNDRRQYAKEYAQWKVDSDIRPQDVALMQADFRAGDMSLRNMRKQEAPMEAFVLNINKQIAKLQTLYKPGDRTGLRLMDLPIRELRMRAKGSGEEAVKASYLLEISNEIGKLSSGSSASIQQLSDSAKEDWKRVHDPNLSGKEILKVVNATRDQANMRLSTWKSAKEVVRSEIGMLGGSAGAVGGAGNASGQSNIGRFTVRVK